MAWSWSHAPEAYEKGRENLGKKPLAWLKVCLAEIRARTPANEDDPDGSVHGFELDSEKYEFGISPSNRKSELADEIWSFAEEQRTCANGGYSPWMCPWGCHTVEW